MSVTGQLTGLTCALIMAMLVLVARLLAQQVADPDFNPKIERPAFAPGQGPVVLLDEAHFNFHTASGRYQSFAALLRRDGYVVNASKEKFSRESLRAGKNLVIANALSARNQLNWNPPFDPSFTDDEVRAVREWVAAGGALFLIVDHFPMPETARKLAEAFGAHFHNGYAVDPQAPLVYRRADKSPADYCPPVCPVKPRASRASGKPASAARHCCRKLL